MVNFVLVSQPLPLSPGFSPSLFFFPKKSARRPFSTESSAFCRQLKRNIHFEAFLKETSLECRKVVLDSIPAEGINRPISGVESSQGEVEKD